MRSPRCFFFFVRVRAPSRFHAYRRFEVPHSSPHHRCFSLPDATTPRVIFWGSYERHHVFFLFYPPQERTLSVTDLVFSIFCFPKPPTTPSRKEWATEIHPLSIQALPPFSSPQPHSSFSPIPFHEAVNLLIRFLFEGRFVSFSLDSSLGRLLARSF